MQFLKVAEEEGFELAQYEAGLAGTRCFATMSGLKIGYLRFTPINTASRCPSGIRPIRAHDLSQFFQDAR
jgi:hypothetical protein